MITIFATPKPFVGHINIIQRNAIKSWKLLHPGCEIILFGDDAGTQEIASELGLRHEKKMILNEKKAKILNYMFDRAHELAKNDILCYVNCDMILMSDFINAIQRVSAWKKKFLMVSRRWNLDITGSIDFTKPDWEKALKAEVSKKGIQGDYTFIDYFAFSKGLYYKNVLPFVLRTMWDDWLIWKARSLRVPVVNASAVITAVHQNHDYSYYPGGKNGVYCGEDAVYNTKLMGGWPHFYTIERATYNMTPGKIKFAFRPLITKWFLRKTRPLRLKIGLSHENLERLISPFKAMRYFFTRRLK